MAAAVSVLMALVCAPALQSGKDTRHPVLNVEMQEKLLGSATQWLNMMIKANHTHTSVKPRGQQLAPKST